MKKSIYFIAFFLLSTFILVAQPESDPRTGNESFDLTSGLIGLAVGGALGFFGGKSMAKKNQ